VRRGEQPADEEEKMTGAHGRFCEVTQLLAGDARGGQLADDLLNACFDHALPLETGAENMNTIPQLVATLERFNAYVQRKGDVCAEGLFVGTPEEVAAWAEDLTWQIWANRPN
jgi:hypothetical protein